MTCKTIYIQMISKVLIYEFVIQENAPLTSGQSVNSTVSITDLKT